MSDHGILPDTELTPAERAVKYTLDVLQTRPELAWYLVGTETLSQLLSAEAHRCGLSGDEIKAFKQKYLSRLDRIDPCACRRCGDDKTCPACDREDV